MKLLFFIIFIFLVGCSNEPHKKELIGTWVYSASKNLQENEYLQSSGVTEAGLDSSFGNLAYVFEEKRTTYTPLPSSEQKRWYYNWRIVDISEKHVLISVNGKEVGFIRDNDCLGLKLKTAAHAHIEYYCRDDDL